MSGQARVRGLLVHHLPKAADFLSGNLKLKKYDVTVTDREF